MDVIDKAAIERALADVRDPELRRPLAELGMLGEIRVDGSDVVVTVALLSDNSAFKETIRHDIESRLAGIPGVRGVRVEFGEMGEAERGDLLGRKLNVRIFEADAKTRVVAVASGKGGVGKSTVTVNLAVALARKGFEVAVIDCDVYGFSVPRMLGVAGRKPTVVDGRILPVPAAGLGVISMGFLVDEERPVLWRGPMLGKLLRQFLTTVVWGEPDFVLMDLPPGTGDMAIDVAQLVPKAELLVVTTPEVVATSVARRAARMAETTKQTILGVVENMSAFFCPCCGEKTAIFGEGGGQAVAEALGVPLLAEIPLTLAARTHGDRGVPLASEDEGPAAHAFAELATRLATTGP